MAISTFSNPIPEIISGLLQGHALAVEMHKQQQDDQEFKTRQALQNQTMSMQDIMNRQVLGQSARPVSDMGTVNLAAGESAPDTTGLPGMSPTQAPGYTRKADASRTVKYGGQSYELKTPEEQQATAQNTQLSGINALATANATAKQNADQSTRRNQLTLEGGGTPAPAGLTGWAEGTPMTRAELASAIEQEQTIQKGYQVKTTPGENIYSTAPAATAPQGQQPTQGQPATEPITIPQTQIPGLPPNLQPKAPVAGAGASPTPPLANNPTANRMRLIASGGPANPTGEYAEFKNTFLPGYYQEHGITNPQAKDESAALQAFQAQKKVKEQPEWAANETELAQRAASSDPAVSGPAQAALKRLDQSRLNSRPINNTTITIPGLGAGTPSASQPTLTGEEFMKTLPAGTAAQVRAIANGAATMPPLGTRGSGALLRDAVYRYDPTFTEQRAQIRKAFTTGPDGRNIGALNTATVHLDQMAEAAKAMKNGSWQPGNHLYNYIASKFGNDKPTNYAFVMNALSGETASALKGAATDPEIAHVMATLTPDMSPDQAAGVANTGLHVFGAKLNTFKERYEQQIPNDTVYSPVLPSARAVFSKYGMSETGAPNGPGGVKAGAQKSYSQTRVGANGQTIGWNPGDANWTDVKTGQVVK